MSDFFALYKRPEWQRKRLEVMEAAGFECVNCGSKDMTLNVHHKFYVKGRKPWEYDESELQCLCEECHKRFHDHKQELLSLIDTGECNIELVLGFVKAASYYPDLEPIPIDSAEQARGAAYFLGWVDGDRDLIALALASGGGVVDSRIIELISDAGLSGMGVAQYVAEWRLIERGFNPGDASALLTVDNMCALWRGERVVLPDGRTFTKAELESPVMAEVA